MPSGTIVAMVVSSQASGVTEDPRWWRVGSAMVRWVVAPGYALLGAATAVVVARPALMLSGESALSAVLYPLAFVLAGLPCAVLAELWSANPWLRLLRLVVTAGLFALVVVLPLEEHHLLHSVAAWSVYFALFLVVVAAVLCTPQAWVRIVVAAEKSPSA